MDTQKLRQRILDLAIRGKLVPQDPDDEPASVLLDRIRAEKERLIAEGKIKRPKARKSTDKSHYQQFTPPFDIPDSWVWVRLEEIIRVKSGENLNVRELQSKDIYPVYGGNRINGYYNKCNVAKDTIIIGRVGFYCGSIHKTNSESWVTDNALIVDTDIVNIDINWLCLVLIWANLRKTSNSTAQPVVSGKSIYPVWVPLPSKDEQSRIVDTFDTFIKTIETIEIGKTSVQKLISLTKTKILDLAMQGKLVPQDPADEPAADMLRRINPKAKIITDNPHYPQLPDNWVLTTVDSVCDYGNSENVSVDDIDSSDWVLELEDIEKDSGRIITQKSKHERTINGVRHRFVNGDVLYSKLRTYLNKVLVAQKDGYCTTEIIPVKSYDCVIPEYLCAWLRSPFFLSYTAECCYGVKMPRLSTTDARKGIIPLPPINEQKRITQKLSKVSELLSSLSNSID